MYLSQESCPYCGHHGLELGYCRTSSHFVTCPGCEARGPKTSADQPPRRLSPLSGDNLLRTVIDESPDIVLVKDFNGDFLLCNRTLARLYGSTPEAMVGKSDVDFNPDREQVAFYKQNIQQVMREGQLQIVEETSTDSETGEVRYFQSIKKPLKGPDGSDRILVIAHDITELKQAYRLIEEKERRYAYAMAAAGEGIWDWDIDRNEVHHNSKWCELLGLDRSLSCHRMEVLDSLLHPEDRAEVMQALNQALSGKGDYSHEHRMVRADGQVIWVHDRGRVVEWHDDGRPGRMVGSASDITARKITEQQLADARIRLQQQNQRLEQQVAERTEALAQANQELRQLALRDPLTGTGNRLLLDQWLSDKTADFPVAVLMLDLDHFKTINDRYGHKCGDQVLQQVAQSLSGQLRQQDLVIRFGGEEFLLVLSGTDLHQALKTAERLRSAVAALDNRPFAEPVTASVGMAAGVCGDFETLVQQADEGLYNAKGSGRNRVACSAKSDCLC